MRTDTPQLSVIPALSGFTLRFALVVNDGVLASPAECAEQAASLLEESGFEKVRWMHSYDPGTAVNARGEASPEGNFQVIAIKLDGSVKVIQESVDRPLRSDAEHYAAVMEKPYENVDNTKGFHKWGDDEEGGGE